MVAYLGRLNWILQPAEAAGTSNKPDKLKPKIYIYNIQSRVL